MLPKNSPTERTLNLQAIVDKTPPEELAQWPSLTRDDYALIGAFITVYCFLDFNLRRIVEAVERAGELPSGLKGKAGYLSIGKVEEAVMAIPELAGDANQFALKRIREHRGMRNLLAHFAGRRFPAEESFLFVTKSVSDFKQVFGREPPPDLTLTAIVDREQMRNVLKLLEGTLTWLGKVAVQVEEQWLPKSSAQT